jgi:hypothetical protein
MVAKERHDDGRFEKMERIGENVCCNSLLASLNGIEHAQFEHQTVRIKS